MISAIYLFTGKGHIGGEYPVQTVLVQQAKNIVLIMIHCCLQLTIYKFAAFLIFNLNS